jgi:mutator protein MutT
MSDPGCVEGVAAVIERAGRLLAVRRAEGIVAAGCWCLPGGAIEVGESPADAVVREVREEVGLDVAAVAALGHWVRPDGGLRITWWRVALADAHQAVRINPADVAEARWVTPAEMRALTPMLQSNLQFLDEYLL